MSSAPISIADTASARRRRFTVDALFADTSPQAVGVTELTTAKEIALNRIEADPYQPRRSLDDARLGELTRSVEIEGVLQPKLFYIHSRT